MTSFNHVEDMLKFIAHGFTVLIGMEMLNINDKDEEIAESHTSYESDQVYLRRLAARFVMRIWQAPPQTELTDVIDVVTLPNSMNMRRVLTVRTTPTWKMLMNTMPN